MYKFFIIIFLSNCCLSQDIQEDINLFYPGKIDSIISGEWFLYENRVVSSDGNDSIPYIRDFRNPNLKTISFNPDSLILKAFSDYNPKCVKYKYSIDQKQLILYQEIQNKKINIESFKIVKCSPRELVIATQISHCDLFDSYDLTIYHIYRRLSQDSEYRDLLRELQSSWIKCTNEEITLPFVDTTKNIEFLFKRPELFNKVDWPDSILRIELNTRLDHYKFQNTLWISKLRGKNNRGGSVEYSFFFDYSLQNIILVGEEILAYRISMNWPYRLTLEYNKELTENLSKEYP